jgi:hypothetical protein
VEALGRRIGVGAERHREMDDLQRIGERLVGVVACDWQAFGLIGLEQSHGRLASAHRSDAPHESMDVLDAGVEAEPAGRGEPVGRVAGQEDAPPTHRLGGLGAHPPGCLAEDLCIELGAGGFVDDRPTPAIGVVVDRFRLRIDAMHEHPVRVDVVGDEDAVDLGIEHEVENRRPLGGEGTQIGSEVDHQEAPDQRRAMQLDLEELANTARSTVAPEDVATAHVPRDSGRQLGDPRNHHVAVLTGVLPPMAVAKLGARRGAELVGQDRFEAVLGQIAQWRRRAIETILALAFERQPADQLAAQPGDEVDMPGVGRVLARGMDALHVQSGLSADLIGSGVDDVRGGRGLGSVASLDDERREAVS